MKRVLLATVATIAGLVALLSFKTHGLAAPGVADSIPPAVLSPGLLPSSAPDLVTTSAPPDPSPTATGSASSSTSRRAPTSTAAKSPASRTVLGSAVTTRFGVVQVRITVSGGHITRASMAQLTAFDGHSAQINSYAAPILLQETIKAQGAHIDTVSGATYTSDGYIQSLQSALDQVSIP